MIVDFLAQCYKAKMRWTRLQRIFSVSPEWVTLDIGSGDSPFAPADVLCEKFPWDDTERTARFRGDRPVVAGDIEALPFRDKVFDYIYCSHVLEHTFSPSNAIKELMRVGRRGYIEVPSSYLEKTTKSNPTHLWFVRLQGGKLVFSPKHRGILDPELNDIFEMLLDKNPYYSLFHYATFYSLFNIGYTWDSSISYSIEQIDVSSSAPETSFEKGDLYGHINTASTQKMLRETGIPAFIKSWVYHRSQRAKEFRIEDLLACPQCKCAVTQDASHTYYLCSSCKTTYPVREGIPILLSETSRPPASLIV